MRSYLPHHVRLPCNTFHRDIDRDLYGSNHRRGWKLAFIAPRYSAKSTWTTLAYVLRGALEGWEPYTVILSDAGDQAEQFLADLKAEAEESPHLHRGYAHALGEGSVWRGDKMKLRNGAVVHALGRGGRIRGRRIRANRPTLIVIDDPQGNRDITSPTERQRAWDWLVREVIPAGTERTNYLAVGTALHREAILPRLQQTAGWAGRTWQSVVRWPERADLWDRWERLLTNWADPLREATAAAFYAADRAEMDRGSEVLWPESRPLYALMARRAEIGPSAFDTEEQGTPHSAEGSEWPAEYFAGAGLWFDEWPACVLYVLSLDPSKGTGVKSGDYQAHVLVGLGTDGTLYVEGWLTREDVVLMVTRSLELARTHKVHALVVEVNDGLGLLQPEFERQMRERKQVAPFEGIVNTQNKTVRVLRLGPYFHRRQVRFRSTPGTRLLVDQLRDFPGGSHDDGPDALELAVRRLELLTAGA